MVIEKQLIRLEAVGAVGIITLGSLLHFTYDWAHGWSVIAIFSAVNESVWEHMKIGFWPTLLFAIILWFYLGQSRNNFWFAETISLYVVTLTIPLLFYSYTGIVGDHILVIDILIFIFAVILGRLTSYWILTKEIQEPWKGVTLVLLLVILFAFSMFTYFPPKLALFKDPLSGKYGI